jgi:PAS domain S-box-containing protein
MVSHRVLLLNIDPSERRRLTPIIEALGCEVTSAGADDDPAALLGNFEDGVVIAVPGFGELEDSAMFAAARPETEWILLEADPRLPWGALPENVTVSAVLPASAPAALLASVLRSVQEKIELRHRLRRRQTVSPPVGPEFPDDRVARERISAVHQVVERLSQLIGDIARDVEGGVKYFNAMPYFIAIHDSNAKVVAANEAYRQMLGGRVGDDSCSVYSGSSAGVKGCPVRRTLETGEPQRSRELVNYRSGARVPVIVHTAAVLDARGRNELVLEVSAGTRELNRLRQDIQSSQQRYEQLFDAVPSYVAVLERGYYFTAVNRAFKEEFGDLTGSHFFDFFELREMSCAKSPVQRTFEDGQPHQSELVLSALNGRQYHTLAWTSPIATAAGKVVQVLMILLDVTRIHRLQNNLSELGLMISSISHSIKSVLTGLDAGVYLMESGWEKGDPEQIQEGLEAIKFMADRIRSIVFDVLYYAKERELKPERIDVVSFAHNVVESINKRFQESGVELVFDFDPQLGAFEIDRGVLCPALVNILENALEACLENESQRPPQVLFRAAQHEGQVIFEIRDNGAGMNEEQLGEVFKMFYSTKGSRGTGLGLYIAKKIVSHHGGTISVTASPGEGACFRVALPERFTATPGRGEACEQ